VSLPFLGAQDSDASAAPGWVILAEAVHAYRSALGERLLGAYALGSLAHGGFTPLVSDVDLGLVLADPLAEADSPAITGIAEMLRASGSELHQRLSVFWGTLSTLRGDAQGGRFPPLDRLDLIEHGRLLDGEDARAVLPRPTRRDILVAGAEFALDFLSADEPRRPELLLERGVRRLTKVVLFPVRFLHAAETGSVGTNHGAVEHYLAIAGAPSRELVAAALGWRTTPPENNALGLLRRHLIPLYLFYIDDHVARLTEAGAPALAQAFTDWRAAITAA
jgi:hypothetical protein